MHASMQDPTDSSHKDRVLAGCTMKELQLICSGFEELWSERRVPPVWHKQDTDSGKPDYSPGYNKAQVQFNGDVIAVPAYQSGHVSEVESVSGGACLSLVAESSTEGNR